MIWSVVGRIFGRGASFKAIEVYPGLFQGSQISSAEDIKEVKRLDIESVIDLEGGFDPPMGFLHTYLFWPFLDWPFLPNLGSLLSVATFGVTQLQAKKKVLVHCRCGLNRSGLVCGRMMNLMGLPGPEILRRMKERIPGSLWNPVFRDYIRGLV
jgi:hypothetical protein